VYPGLIGPSGDAPSSLIGRATDSSADTCYKVVCSVAGTSRVTLYKVIAGATTELAGADVESYGTTVSLRISSSTIQVLLNASSIISTTDTSIAGPGYWGFGLTYGENGEDIGSSSVGALTLQAVGVLGTLARVDGADTLSASATISGASSVEGTLSVTDGTDTVNLAGTLGVTSTLALTDGTDATSLAGVVDSGAVTLTLAVTDGADTLSIAGTVALAGTLSVTDATDVYSVSGSVVAGSVSGTLSTTDGTDVTSLAGAVSLSGTLAKTDGADITALAGVVDSGVIDGTLGVTDGADLFSASGSTGSTAAGGYDDDKPKRKKRFVVEQDGKLLVFGSARAAVEALGQQKAIEAVVVEPEQALEPEISLPAVQAYAEVRGLVDDYQAALRNRHYLALIAMFMDMRDEEDVELLLMHA
jgi:hypothetical protein